MIRDATLDDIPAMLDMGERFAAKAKLPFAYDRESTEATLTFLIQNANGICLVCDDGCAGGLCHDHPFNTEVKVGAELFWWSEGRQGAGLFDAMEDRAKTLGCRFWSMISLEAIRPQATGRLYQRRRYELREHTYVKELT